MRGVNILWSVGRDMSKGDTGGDMYSSLRDILPRKVRDKARAARLTRFARIMGGKNEAGNPIAGKVILNDVCKKQS